MKSSLNHSGPRAALISVCVHIPQHAVTMQSKLQDHEYGTIASRLCFVVCFSFRPRQIILLGDRSNWVQVTWEWNPR